MSEHDDCICRTIPAKTKQIARGRCFFGCAICGLPMYHYDHIDDFAVYRNHAPDNIVLLCPNHHQDKTSGRISKDYVRHFANHPVNRSHDRTAAPYAIRLAGQTGIFHIGGNTYIEDFLQDNKVFAAIVMHGRVVVGLQYRQGLLSLWLYMTDPSGQPVLVVENGEMVVSTGVWDYTLEGRTITIRSRPRNLLLEIEIMENGLFITQGHIVMGQTRLVITPENHSIFMNGSDQPMYITNGNTFRNCGVGFIIGQNNL